MTKKLKGFLITIFSAVMILSALFVFMLTPRTSARADGEPLTPSTTISALGNITQEGGFSFSTSASIRPGRFIAGEYRDLVFNFNLLQSKHSNLFEYPNDTDENNDNRDLFGQCIQEEFAYKFTVLKSTTTEETGDKAAPIIEYYIIFGTGLENVPVTVLYRNVAASPQEKLTFLNINIGNDFDYDSTTSATKSIKYLGIQSAKGFDLRMLDGTDGGLFVDGKNAASLIVENVNPAAKYQIRFDYVYHNSTNSNSIGGASYNDIQTDSCKSEAVSFLDVLTNIKNSSDGLEGFFEKEGFGTTATTAAVTAAESLLLGTAIRDVTVRYQKRIEGTPFAERVEKVVSAPVWGEGEDAFVLLDDIKEAFGTESLETLNAAIQTIKRVDTDVFEIEYHYSGWLRLINNDGHFVDVFASVNESFKSYYHKYVDMGALSEAAYSYNFNELIKEYPILNNYSTRQDLVYGLWGMLVLPKTYSLNDFAAEFLQPNKTKGEHVSMYTFTHDLTYEEYQILQEEFDYGGLASAWNDVAGFVEGGGAYQATYHIVYLNPETSMSWLDLRGEVKNEDDAKDPNQNGIIDGGIKGITGAIGGFFGGIIDGATGVIGGLGDLFSGMSSSPGGLVGLGLIAAAVIVIIILIKKGTFGGKRK